MSTTKDLSQLIDREMGNGQGPFLVRICQDAGLLPKVKRGAGRSMEDLTADHLAGFVIAVAGTRAVGQRSANGARAAVKRFATLQMDWKGERGVRSLREDLVFFLEQYRDKGVIGEDYDFLWILFVDDTEKPEVEFRFIEEAGGQQVRNYSDPDAQPSPVREATVIEGAFLETLAVMLRKVDAKAEDASA